MPWRFRILLVVVILAISSLIIRIVNLTIFNQQFLINEGRQRVLRQIATPTVRGMIVDRKGEPLAVSAQTFSVWVNPKEFNPNDKSFKRLSQLLNIKQSTLMATVQMAKKKNRQFLYLKRSLSPHLVNRIQALEIPGLYRQASYRRYYPEGEITGQLIGFTNVDDKGQEGIELGYNDWLTGDSEKRWVIKDRIGRIIADVSHKRTQKKGNDLVLSIDKRIQYFSYRALLAGVIDNQAHAGSAVVLNAKTGEVLAMANYPSFNPNKKPIKINEFIRNRAITDTFEPGSTVKAFSMASAFETGKFKADTIIDTTPGWMRVGKNLVRDIINYGPITITKILQVSSNVGISKIILQLPPDHLWHTLQQFGFGEITGIGFPGEQSGQLVKPPSFASFPLATLSFGYGISVTALQLARAYAVLANGGVKLPITLLRIDQPPPGERVLKEGVANQILLLLESVLNKGGTGKRAHIDGYRIAGKTGTTRINDKKGYSAKHHEASFVGIAPLTNPRLIVAVVIHDPQGKHYHGGDVAAPIFKTIMRESLRLLDVLPDDPTHQH